MSEQVRVRFAPSPTGMLHIGGLRTALYNYLFARKHKGTFVLRIEDTDQTRFVEDAEQDIITSLRWAGLDVDEGPGKEGDCAPYRQSERSVHYKKYADQLIEQGHAYYAFDTQAELDDMRDRLQKSGNPSPKYDAITRQSMTNSLTLPAEEVQRRLERGDEYVVRLKVPRRETIRFEDIIRGFVSFESQGLDDQVLLKSDGLPTYHLANVVDDHLMKITHVIRGEEWLSSAPKHILLYEYLGWTPPQMAHLPLILSPQGGKLSKRNAEALGIPVNVRDYIKGQYEPEALVNFLAFLGWSPGDNRELLSLNELIDAFELERVSKSGAVFNHQKLMWFNEHYMRALPQETLLHEVRTQATKLGYAEKSDAFLTKMIELLKERAQLRNDFVPQGTYFFEAPASYDDAAVKKSWKPETKALVLEYKNAISSFSEAQWNAVELKQALTTILEANNLGFGKLALPLRISITGIGAGPELFEVIALLSKEDVLSRIDKAIATLG